MDNRKINATVEITLRTPAKTLVLRFRQPKAAPIQSVAVKGTEWTAFAKAKATIEIKGLHGMVAVTATH